MHKLWIMRHGQAQSSAPTDALRPLTDVGCQQVAVSAQHLANEALTHVFVSPYLRAQQTWQVLQQQGISSHCVETVDWITPDVPTTPALDALLALEGDETLNILLVCHQTFAGRLATHLCDGTTQGRHVDTAGVVSIHAQVFAAQCGLLQGVFSCASA